jgi:hypothetical protein
MGWASLIGPSPKKCYQSLGTPKIDISFSFGLTILVTRGGLWAMDMGQSVVLLGTHISIKKIKKIQSPYCG